MAGFKRACVGVLVLASLACKGPGDGAEVDDLTRVYVPAGAPDLAVTIASDARPGAVVERDLVIDSGTFEPELRSPVALAAADDGHIVMLDILRRAVRVYSAAGELETEIERDASGSGPTPLAISTAGDEIVLMQGVANGGVIGYFDMELVHKRDQPLDDTMVFGAGVPDGSVVGLMWIAHRPEIELVRVRPWRVDDRSLVRLTLFERPERSRQAKDLWPNPSFTVGADRVYVTASARYEVVAFDLDGEPAWTLTAGDWTPTRIPEEVLQRPLGRERRSGRGMSANTTAARGDWPVVYPAIETLSLDGHGRLYVFPYVPRPESLLEFPVDVYSPDGDLIVQTTLPFQGWSDAVGDHVYRVERERGHVKLIRYRLTLPTVPSPPDARVAQ